MKYPIFNLFPEWKEELIQEFVRHDNEYYSDDNEFFNTYFLGQTFIDSEGKLYELDYAEDYTVTKFWLFKSRRKRLYFKSLHKTFSFEELKSELQKRANTLSLVTVREDFAALIKSVDSIKDLLGKM